jgi:hypothetical protein
VGESEFDFDNDEYEDDRDYDDEEDYEDEDDFEDDVDDANEDVGFGAL